MKRGKKLYFFHVMQNNALRKEIVLEAQRIIAITNGKAKFYKSPKNIPQKYFWEFMLDWGLVTLNSSSEKTGIYLR